MIEPARHSLVRLAPCRRMCTGNAAVLVLLSSNHIVGFIVLNFVADLFIWIGTLAFGRRCTRSAEARGVGWGVDCATCYISSEWVGPLATAALSDHLAVSHGDQSLRYALMIMTASLLPTALAFYASGRLVA